LAVQKQSEAAHGVEITKARFPILADSEHAVASEYGLYHLFLDYEAAASVFIISQDGRIIWDSVAAVWTDRVPSQTILENLPVAEETVSSLNPVTTPDGDQVGESELERETDKIVLNFEACCVTPGNAYTAWWLIGDVTKPMSAVKTLLATGFVAEDEQVRLELELKAGLGGINNPLDGVRLAVLDHGLATGDPLQLSTPGGGCTTMPCPVAFETSHAAP
jgi:hypothetical protein